MNQSLIKQTQFARTGRAPWNVHPRRLASSRRAPVWTALATATLAALPTPAAEPPANAASAAPAAKPAPANAGLLNDWLRDQSSGWQSWDLGGQFRARYEVFDGGSLASATAHFQRSGADNDNSYFWTREKLHVGYQATWFSAYAEGRNSNSVGDDDPKNSGEDSFDLHQAYVGLGNAREFPLTAKVGRQELVYGDERLVGRSDWGNTGRVFDAAKLRYENKHFWADVFAGRVVVPVDGEFNEADSQDWFFGGYAASKTLIPIQETQLYFLSRNVSPGSRTAARDIYSVGARVKSLPGKLKGWDYTAEVVKQMGNIVQSGARKEQSPVLAGGHP